MLSGSKIRGRAIKVQHKRANIKGMGIKNNPDRNIIGFMNIFRGGQPRGGMRGRGRGR